MDMPGAENDAHPCPTPRVGAGHSKPPKGWQEGAVFACECGRLHALRNRWNYAGNWWEWQRIPLPPEGSQA